MAKFFKPLPLASSAVPKPLFERDFFDMTEEAASPVLPLTTSATPPVSSPTKHVDAPDLIADRDGQQRPVVRSAKAKAGKKVGGPAVQNNPDKKDNSGIPGNTPQPGVPPAPAATTLVSEGKPRKNRDVRQTFILTEHDLEQIRDYVHARRSQGDYNYSQKQLLQEALKLFLASQNPTLPRPTELREREKQLRVRIQEGRQANAGHSRSAEPGKATQHPDADG